MNLEVWDSGEVQRKMSKGKKYWDKKMAGNFLAIFFDFNLKSFFLDKCFSLGIGENILNQIGKSGTNCNINNWLEK